MSETTASWLTPARTSETARDEGLTRFHIQTLIVLSLLLAVMRIASMASGPWDWDEALFSLAVQGDYDVTRHHPHPPGFPLYIGAARLIAPLSGTFPALQSIVLVSAIALLPLMFFVGIEMGFESRTSLVGATLLACLPNVMIFSGSGFSDIPSLALTLSAVLLLLRGRRSSWSFMTGTLMSAFAVGVRIQSVLACVAPGVLSLRKRRTGEIVRGILLAAAVVLAIYGTAAVATGSFEKYRSAIVHHGNYIATHDSFRSPTRPPLQDVFGTILRPWEAGELGGVILFFMVIALVDMIAKRHAPSLLAVATFGPFLFFAWLMLDPNSLSRFSIGYMPLHALLAARGITITSEMLSGWLQLRSGALVVFLGASLSISMLAWVRAPLRSTIDEAPPVAAMSWVKNNLAVNDATIWVEGPTLGPFADLELPGWHVRQFERWSDIAPSATDSRRNWVIVEGTNDDAMVTFSRTERHLRQVVRNRYFGVSVIPLDATVAFGDGWYGQEGSHGAWWRWMRGEAELVVPGSTRVRHLHLVLGYPSETLERASIVVRIDEAPVEVPLRPFAGVSDFDIPLPPSQRERRITIRVTPTIRPVDVGASGDERVLGARLLVCDLR